MARLDDDQRVFDVSRPPKTSPPATSRPIIVGHTPAVNDPMVKAEETAPSTDAPKPKPVPVLIGDEPEPDATQPTPPVPPAENPIPPVVPVHTPDNAAAAEPTPPPGDHDHPGQPDGEHTYTPLSALLGGEDGAISPQQEVDNKPQTGVGDSNHLVGSLPLPHPPGAGPRSIWRKIIMWLFIILLLGAIAAYFAIDAGWIGKGIKLPYDFIKNSSDNQAVTPPPAPVAQTPPADSLPSGFVKYDIEGTSISFAYPEIWGTATTAVDPGFSSRGSGKTTDGSHAYIIGFSKDKNVQVALTSAKFLPAARDATFSDYLQWCVGTVDSKIYYQTLHFKTATGIDTPTTAVCDNGPLEAVSKINDNTIVQVKFTDAGGKIIGDLYTMNLKDNDTPVFRVLDKSMDHISDVKILLTTVKVQ